MRLAVASALFEAWEVAWLGTSLLKGLGERSGFITIAEALGSDFGGWPGTLSTCRLILPEKLAVQDVGRRCRAYDSGLS